MHDPARAISCFESVLQHKGSVSALLALEALLAQLGDWQRLAHIYMRLANTLTDPAARLAAWRELARLQETKGIGEPADRADTYEEILAMAPGDAEALRGLADVARRTSDVDMLARVYSRLGEAEPDQGVAAHHWLRLGHVLEAIKAPGAIDAYRAALRKTPESLSAIRGLGRLAEASGDLDGCIEAARREAAVTMEPGAAADLLVRSATLCLDRGKDTNAAAADLERAVELAPKTWRRRSCSPACWWAPARSIA